MVVQRFCRGYTEPLPSAVFHYKYQSYKYERNTAGKPASMWVGVEPISTTLSAMQILHGGMNDFQQSHLNDDIV